MIQLGIPYIFVYAKAIVRYEVPWRPFRVHANQLNLFNSFHLVKRLFKNMQTNLEGQKWCDNVVTGIRLTPACFSFQTTLNKTKRLQF